MVNLHTVRFVVAAAAIASVPCFASSTLAQTDDAKVSGAECIKALEESKVEDFSKRMSTAARCAGPITEICAEAAMPENLGSPQSKETLKHWGTCLRVRRAGLTAGPATPVVAAEAIRSVSQVVATKAQAAGWPLLLRHLRENAHCKDVDSKFPDTCKVLASLDLKDLVSSPSVLINATIADLLNLMVGMKDAGSALIGASPIIQRWTELAASRPGMLRESMLQFSTRETLVDHVVGTAGPGCNPRKTIGENYAYLLGLCLLGSGEDLTRCDADTIIDSCSPPPSPGNGELRYLWRLTTLAFPKAPAVGKPIDHVNLLFALGRAELDVWKRGKDEALEQAAQEFFSGSEDLISGLVIKDWVEASSGAVRIVNALAAADPCKPGDGKECPNVEKHQDAAKLLALLAAVGNYALTFDPAKNPDPKEAAATRDRIITELADRMVSRTSRIGGVVVSLGGTLGLLGGQRFAKTDEWRREWAFPVQLALGLGVQTYHRGNAGAHFLVSAFDVGQYVNWNDTGDLEVAQPELKSAINLGFTAGFWFGLRETPLHLALHGAMSPFNRADGKATYQAGVVLGIYVPLLDLN